MTRASLSFALLFALACDESAPTDVDSGSTPMDAGGGTDTGTTPGEDTGTTPMNDAGTGEDTGSTPGEDAGGGDDAGGDGDSGTPPTTTGVVINEIDANAEWTELFNTGSAAVDLSMHRVCDSDAMGVPRLNRCATFPAGFMLDGGAYIVIIETDPPLDGVQVGSACGEGERCIHSDWGISDGDGETIHLLPPDGNDTPIATQPYPMMAAPDGDSYCRLPNGTGEFAACEPTPTAANMAAMMTM